MNVVIAPDQRLRVKTKTVKKITPDLIKLIKEMARLTKTFMDPEGVGLASTQIGRDERFFITKNEQSSSASKDGGFEAIFNPEIISFGKKNKVYFEGCLSIPNYYGEVTRPITIKVKYMDQNGNMVTKNLLGVDAWIFQHEMDHLEGKLFVDKVLEQKSKMFKVIGRDRAGSEIFQEIKM